MKAFFPYPLRLLVGLVATAGLVHAQPTPPTMSTLPANPVGATNATLNGTANPDGLAMAGWFEWGTTTNYGNITPAQALGSGGSNTNFSRGLASLTPGVAYHFRAVVSNSFYVVSGTNQSFTTRVFTDIGAGLHGMDTSSGVWGDFDNDGRLDFVLSGRGTNIPGPSGFSSGLWKNTGSGFTNSNNLSLTYKGIAWGDYDNDGRLDLLIADRVLRHTGSSFVDIQTGFPQPFFGSTTWGDYDGDGRMDVLVTGLFSYDPGDPFAPVPAEADVWLNRPAGFVRANTGLAGVSGAAAWGDYDSDGRLDVALSGFTNGLNYETLSSRILRNTGAGFSNINAGLPGLFSDSLAWGDYDNDGRPDLLLAGQSATGVVSQVWRNTGNGFSNINAGLPGVYFGSAAWGDYDNDGRLDILLTGATNYVSGTWTGFVSQVWRNTGNGFTNLNAGLPGVYSGSAAWGDYDNDGRLDILLTGTNATLGRISQVWRNHSPATNTPPSAPTGLTVTLAGNNAFFSWNAGTDVQTPAAGLTMYR